MHVGQNAFLFKFIAFRCPIRTGRLIDCFPTLHQKIAGDDFRKLVRMFPPNFNQLIH